LWPHSWAKISWVGIVSLWYESESWNFHQKITNFHFHPSEQWTKNELVQALEPIPNYQGVEVPPRLACQILVLKNIGSTSPHFGIMYFIMILNYESFKCLLYFILSSLDLFLHEVSCYLIMSFHCNLKWRFLNFLKA
jgi:hypothetical protein